MLAALAHACSSPVEQVQVQNTGWAQGTTYSIRYVTTPGHDLHDSIRLVLANIDRGMSTYVKGSAISRLNDGERVYVDPDFLHVLLLSREVWQASSGAFDPTVKPLVDAWGFGPDGAVERAPRRLDSLVKLIGLNKVILQGDSLKLPRGMELDFNAIAQGYTADAIAALLLRNGIENYMVEVGGEVAARGMNVDGRIWRIGIDEPIDSLTERKLIAVVELNNAGLATSGNYRKFWTDSSGQRFVHTIHPQLGTPVKSQLLSASIIAESAARADGLATAAMVMGWPEASKWIQTQEGVEAYFVYLNDLGKPTIWKSKGFPVME